jgi:hypothetical protein
MRQLIAVFTEFEDITHMYLFAFTSSVKVSISTTQESEQRSHPFRSPRRLRALKGFDFSVQNTIVSVSVRKSTLCLSN